MPPYYGPEPIHGQSDRNYLSHSIFLAHHQEWIEAPCRESMPKGAGFWPPRSAAPIPTQWPRHQLQITQQFLFDQVYGYRTVSSVCIGFPPGYGVQRLRGCSVFQNDDSRKTLPEKGDII